ncbi:Chaperone protein TorD [Vibrio stylophorae]|uniref:Chaperone protein TorD n=1 Tax=Vibrio stylophorae TaxID=659351 RepID=A0ABM8ZQS0_9VIBR|nr:molecular chaperone TorD [Vibrio stylophorae]CAH0532237.1 Chaperone protein TorD [Vibrio stylophorae]
MTEESEVIQTLRQQMKIRANLYWWFANLLGGELTVEQLSELSSEYGQNVLATLAEQPCLAPHVQRLRDALTLLNSFPYPELELASDYADLFLADVRVGAPPYASLYYGEVSMLYQAPHQMMLELLQQHGLASEQFEQPADHLAIELDLMGNLALKAANTPALFEACVDQQGVLGEQLRWWVQAWCDACQRFEGNDFYPALSQLLVDFLNFESQWLGDVVDALRPR